MTGLLTGVVISTTSTEVSIVPDIGNTQGVWCIPHFYCAKWKAIRSEALSPLFGPNEIQLKTGSLFKVFKVFVDEMDSAFFIAASTAVIRDVVVEEE
jgi:hypothetical protein